MTFSLSKALQVVCYLWAASALLLVAMPFIDVALHRYEGVIDFFAGLFVGLFGLIFYFLARCKIAKQPAGHPVIAGILWAVAVIFGLAAIRLLYFCLFA
jgi:hypothetical protein